MTLSPVLKSVATTTAGVLTTFALLGAAGTAHADVYKVAVSAPPNWALGSPQFVLIGGCSELDLVPGSCGSNVGLSDRLSLQVPTRAAISLTLSEAEEAALPHFLAPFFGGGILDLIIPNANWVFPRFYAWRDAPNEGFASDYLLMFNFGATAHLFLSSNNSDLDTSVLPMVDAIYAGVSATLPAQVDITSFIDPTTGEFTLPGGDPGLNQAPEPSSIMLLLLGISAVTLAQRRSAPLPARRPQSREQKALCQLRRVLRG